MLFVLLICCSSVYGQSKYAPSAFRAGIDLTNVGYTLFNSNHSQYEVNADLQFGKYFFVADYGFGNRTYHNEFIYNYDGQYFRAGVDINLLKNDPDHNVIFAGLRYARSFYSDQIKYTITDEAFGPINYEFKNSTINGRWMELVGGMKIRVWGQLFLGYTLRFKFMQKTSGAGDFTTYEMPGYGKAAKKSTVGFNYHIFYRIPFK